MVGLQTGGAAAITVRGDEMTEAAAGVINADGDAITVDTPMFIDGAATPFSTAIILQLVDKGKVDLDDLVRTYLPDVEPLDAAATVRDLLTFREGSPPIYRELTEAMTADPGQTWTTAEMLEFAEPLEPNPVGQPLRTITGAAITWLLVEALDGRSYAESLSARVVEPLGLTSTGFITGDAPIPDGMGAGWSPPMGFIGDPSTEIRAITSVGETYASARDLLKFADALQEGRLLSEESMSLMFDPEADMYSAGLSMHETIPGIAEDGQPRLWAAMGQSAHGHGTVWAMDPASGDIAVIVASSLEIWPFDLLADWYAAGRARLEPSGTPVPLRPPCPC